MTLSLDSPLLELGEEGLGADVDGGCGNPVDVLEVAAEVEPKVDAAVPVVIVDPLVVIVAGAVVELGEPEVTGVIDVVTNMDVTSELVATIPVVGTGTFEVKNESTFHLTCICDNSSYTMDLNRYG